MNTSNNHAWERTKERAVIVIGTTVLDTLACSNFTTEFFKYRLVENTKTMVNHDDQTIPDLFKSFIE